jgi:class 3 adenylate cyclase
VWRIQQRGKVAEHRAWLRHLGDLNALPDYRDGALLKDPKPTSFRTFGAAIFAGDIAGYGRLMGADEEGTLRQLKGHRKELVDPKITEHRGRIVKTTGDGMLVEFVSVVDAVRCAVDIQRGMLERNSNVPTEKEHPVPHWHQCRRYHCRW